MKHADFPRNAIILFSRFFSPRFFGVLIALIAGCAGQRPPEGGPVDDIPPEIISVYPPPNSVNFSDRSIVLEFSEYVDRRSAEEAIFISPSIEDKEYDWSGTELEITFNEELRKNTTYVVTIGTDVTDIRARNRMVQAFTLSFSTGQTMDNGMVTGQVFDEKPEGVMIYSYRLDGILADTLYPAVTKPDYLTQTGTNGDFILKNIAPGSYRLIAVRDEYRNLLYDPETDAVGTTDDLKISRTDSLKTGIAFTIAKEDTTPPRITSVEAADAFHLIVQVSEPLDSATVAISSFSATDTLRSVLLPIHDIFPNNKDFTKFTVVTGGQTADERYLLTLSEVRDHAGYMIHPSANAKQFSGSSIKDTIPPSILFSSIGDPLEKIFPGDPLLCVFNDVLAQPIEDSSVSLKRTRDSSIVPTRIVVRNVSTVEILPAADLRSGEQYSLHFHPGGIADRFGNAITDSLLVMKFSVEDQEDFGSIQGRFAGFSDASSVIQAVNIVDKKQKPRKVKTSDQGKFSFNRLPDGKYALMAFDDVNGNHRLDAGRVFPFLRAERFVHHADTIRVRARWPVDGVLFKGN